VEADVAMARHLAQRVDDVAVSTAPTATAGSSGLNWKKFSLSIRRVSQYSRAARERPIARAT